MIVNDRRFAIVDVDELEQRPPSWHAAWAHPDQPDAQISVWRMSVSEQCGWMTSRGTMYDVPADVWQTVAERGVIDPGPQTSYDVQTGLLISVRGVSTEQLVPIGLAD